MAADDVHAVTSLRARPDAAMPAGPDDAGQFGRPARRREDLHHLLGRGRFTDDIVASGEDALHLTILRSPHAHARIRRIDVARAKAMPGVIEVLTGADLTQNVGPLRANWIWPRMPLPEHRALSEKVARYVGEGVALVVATDRYIAADALEAIDIDYEVLAAVTDPYRAAQAGASVVHPELDGASIRGNVLQHVPVRAGNYAAARRKADVIVTQRLRNQNLVPGAMEPRSVHASYDMTTDAVTIHLSSQAPHIMKRMLAQVLNVDEHRLRVIAPDVGGGFGAKLHLYPEDVLVTAMAFRLKRAVKWTSTRTEDFLSTNHGRDHVQEVEICATRDGTITGLKATIWGNLGAYVSGMGPGIPAVNCGMILTGVYRIPNLHVDTHLMLTNTSRVDTYRGAGRPEATYLIETMVDRVARRLGLDPVEVRRRNFIPPSAFPYTIASHAFCYDSGDYPKNLDKALEIVGYASQRAEQERLRKRGRYLGIGLATYTEFTGIGNGNLLAMFGFNYGGWEYGRVLVHPTGTVEVHTGSADQGQGHATSYVQIVCDVLEIPARQCSVVEGDTGQVEFGLGTFNSRSMAVGGAALHEAARRLLAKAKRMAAHALGVTADDIVYAKGIFSVRREMSPFAQGSRVLRRGTRDLVGKVYRHLLGVQPVQVGAGRDKISWEEVARLAHFLTTYPNGLEPGLDERVFHRPKDFVFPFGTYAAVVEVDVETGDVDVRRLVAVDDCGRIINPLLARGQVHGGAAQGLGQALLEQSLYTDDGRPRAANWMGYAFPRALHMPYIEAEHTVTPTDRNALGVKGIGESGRICTPPAIVNAVLDALSPLGVTHLDMPLLPEQVLSAISTARRERSRSVDAIGSGAVAT